LLQTTSGGRTPTGGATPRDPRSAALAECRSGLGAVAGLSAAMNLLALSGSVFMMLVYDMVLPSRNSASLLGLLAILAVCYAFQHVVDLVRAKGLRQCGAVVGERLHDRCADASRRLTLAGRSATMDPVRDLDTVRSFLSGPGPVAMIDLPWAVLFVGVLWALHPWLGAVTLAGVVVMTFLTLRTERAVSGPTKEAEEASVLRQAAIEQRRRSAETIRALGMVGSVDTRVSEHTRRHLELQERLASRVSTLGGASRTIRMMLQSLVLATGAVLVVRGDATGGVIFASSILSARALSPVDVAIANWRGFSAARAAWRRLGAVLSAIPAPVGRTPLPAPVATLVVENLGVAPPGVQRPTMQGVAFVVRAGSAVAVVGPSGGGKTTLLKTLVGAWTQSNGSVRLDGAALEQWEPDALGRHLGWLPQEIGLFEGTVAENVSRLDPEADPERVVAAAKAAGAHETITGLSEGYDTRIGDGGLGLSSGQRQRIGLARALYGDPFLVVLDEPAANLDGEGEAALVRAIADVRRRGGICVVSAHRPSVIKVCDLALVMRDGRQQAFGPTEKVFSPRPQGEPSAAIAAGATA
jgi:PrtD family type I secretion system ABC transporter